MAKQFFKKHPYKGLFIVVEGLDGSGASTQVGRIANALRSKIAVAHKKTKVIATKEPTDNVIGGLIRGALTGIYQLDAEVLQLLFTADRGHHLQRLVIPSLKAGNIVICDRYFWSTIAFGGLSSQKQWLMEINRHFILPDISIILRLDPAVCVKRITADRFDIELFEEKKKLSSIWKNYAWLIKQLPKNIFAVEGDNTPDRLTDEIVGLVEKHTKIRKMIGA